MQKVPQRKISIIQIAYASEWALAKFFPNIFENGLENYINLAGICGLERDTEDVRDSLISEIEKRAVSLQKGKTWRMENTLKEIKSAINLLDFLSKDGTLYQTAESAHLCSRDYEAGAIFTTNTTHLSYIRKLIKLGKHVLCEKPLVPVTDENHIADRRDLESLEHLVRECENPLILMDAEHYSAKKATKAFYENIGEMVASYGKISGIIGYTKEIDDPDKERTKRILSRKNRTGLLLDMGVHTFGLIANIGGSIGTIKHAEYAIYPGYDVETRVKTKFSIIGELFHDCCSAQFTYAKFVDRFFEPEGEDKKAEITFEKRGCEKTVAIIDFGMGTLTDSRGREWHTEASGEEYVNILKDFYYAIIRQQQPRTNFENSIKGLDAIHRVYETYPVMKNLVEVYKK